VGMEDPYERVPKMIALSKTFLSILDKKKGIAELMPFELFIDNYLQETTWIAGQILSKHAEGKLPFKAKSHFYHLDGRVE
jgi:hypothetical protein